MTTGEIGKRLGRDPSMISRLYRDYEGKRDRQREKRLSRLLSRRVQTHACPPPIDPTPPHPGRVGSFNLDPALGNRPLKHPASCS